MWEIVTTLETTLVGTVVGLAVDFLRNLGPTLIYATDDTIPIRLPDKYEFMAAFQLRVRNISRKKAESVTLHLRAGDSSLRVSDYSIPPGLQLTPEPDGKGIKITFPYLKPKDRLRLLVVAQGSYVPATLSIDVSSPNKIAARRVLDFEARKPFFRFTFIGFFATLSAAAILLIVFSLGKTAGLTEHETPPSFVLDRRMVTISAATDSGLPSFATALANAPELTYYEAGDLAYDQAASSVKPEEVDKYRRFISTTLSAAPDMAPPSQANLFYCLGKLDLLRSDEKDAVADFKSAIAKSKSTLEDRLRFDPKTEDFLVKHSLI